MIGVDTPQIRGPAAQPSPAL